MYYMNVYYIRMGQDKLANESKERPSFLSLHVVDVCLYVLHRWPINSVGIPNARRSQRRKKEREILRIKGQDGRRNTRQRERESKS